MKRLDRIVAFVGICLLVDGDMLVAVCAADVP